jgi:hypothetical protein
VAVEAPIARGRRIDGEPGTGWRTATDAQKGAWLMRIAAKCMARRCRKFKSRPSSVCGQCGDAPVPVGTDPYHFDRMNGWDFA